MAGDQITEAVEALNDLKAWPGVGHVNGAVTALGARQLDGIADTMETAIATLTDENARLQRDLDAMRAERDAAREALFRIAIRDRHGRRIKPNPDGGLRGVGGMIAAFALMGVNGSYVTDEEIVAAHPDIASALALKEKNHGG